MDVLTILRDAPKSAVFALYNPKKKKVFVTLARNYLKRISTLVTELNDGSFKDNEMCQDFQDLKLILLETSNHPNTAANQERFRLQMHYWQEYVEKLGLSHYGKRHIYVKYKPRITTGLNYEGDQVVFVTLVSKRNDKTTIGVFDNAFDAQEFKKEYLDTQSYIYPVYALNDLTRRYCMHEMLRLSSTFKIRID